MLFFHLNILFFPISSTNYRKEMFNLLSSMKSYALSKNPSFEFLNNGALEIFTSNSDFNWTENDINNTILITNGVLVEGVFYGIDENYNMKDNYKTPEKISNEFLNIFSRIKNKIVCLNLDYCNENSKVENSYKLSNENNLISFAAFARELNLIENGKIYYENSNDIFSLKNIKNYLIVLNYDKNFIYNLKQTNYDLIIIDISMNENKNWTKNEIESLKTKKNGAKRIIFCYMSVSEIVDYRKYWNSEWKKNPPEWFDKQNENWGGFRVKYWNEEWKKILFGNNESYLDAILEIGYDGVFLDNVDTFVFFEENGENSRSLYLKNGIFGLILMVFLV